jgi:hypothetical protein
LSFVRGVCKVRYQGIAFDGSGDVSAGVLSDSGICGVVFVGSGAKQETVLFEKRIADDRDYHRDRDRLPDGKLCKPKNPSFDFENFLKVNMES